jgi:6-phosphogluconolactonase (cycloisomerase 2 family)
MHRARLTIIAVVFGLLLASVGATQAATTTCGAGQVYTETNDPAGNQLVVLKADRAGALTQRQLVDAGGLGTGSHITSGGSVTVSTDGCRVAAVNAASGAVAVFRIATDGTATFAGSAAAGGARAISVALHGNLLATMSTTPGSGTTIQTFHVAGRRVVPVPGSLVTVGTATDGGQLAFTARGRFLVVTTRQSLGIVTFRVGSDGVPVAAESLVPNAPQWTYGFGLTAQNQAIVSMLGVIPPTSGSYGSFAITPAGGITTVTTPIPNQVGACWVAVSPSGGYAWGVNADGLQLATLSVSKAGAIAVTGTTSTGTTEGRDLTVSANGKYVYLLRPDAKDILSYRVGASGALALIGSTATPTTAVATGGIAAS